MSRQMSKLKFGNLVVWSMCFIPVPLVVFGLACLWDTSRFAGTGRVSTLYTRAVRDGRPLVIYAKPRKTGSTFIASKLGVSILQSGGSVAPCQVSSLMSAGAEYYGLVQQYDLLGCHMSMRRISIQALSRLPRELVFVTSIREPVGWFLSAAVWVYEKQERKRVNGSLHLREALDMALDGSREFGKFRRLFWENYGVRGNDSRDDVRRMGNLYGYVIQHDSAKEDVNDMLSELGYEVHAASLRREGVYQGEWWGGYRREEIDREVSFERMIFEELGKVRMARKGRDVPWAKIGGERHVVYGAVGSGADDKMEQ